MEPIDLPSTLKDIERSYIKAALDWSGGNIGKAAKQLGIKRTTLRAKVHTNEIQPPKEPILAIIDPLGDFAIIRAKSLVKVTYQEEVIKTFRTITAANAFMQEKMDE